MPGSGGASRDGMQSPHSRNAEAALPCGGGPRYAEGVMKTITPDTLISPADLLERLDWRYAVKQFDPSLRIDEPTWNALEESLRLSPSSGGLQPWKFVVVAEPT